MIFLQKALYTENLVSQLQELRRQFTPVLARRLDECVEGESGYVQISKVLYESSKYKTPLISDGHLDIAGATEWLQGHTLEDLSPIAGREFATIDGWMTALEDECGMFPAHTSGTSGHMGFIPKSQADLPARIALMRDHYTEWFGIDAPEDYTVVFPNYADGRSGILQLGRLYRLAFNAVGDRFVALFPIAQSADAMFLKAQAETAHREGRDFDFEPSAYALERLAEMEAANAKVDHYMEALLDRLAGPLKGRKILLASPPLIIYRLAVAGLERGLDSLFGEGSAVHTFGGYKTHPGVPDFEAVVGRFTGTDKIIHAYGLTEVTGPNDSCEKDRYHVAPTTIPFLFDLESGELLPREGVQRGRAGFFDLIPTRRWGGVLSDDVVSIDWSPCACGRPGPQILPDIGRIDGLAPPS